MEANCLGPVGPRDYWNRLCQTVQRLPPCNFPCSSLFRNPTLKVILIAEVETFLLIEAVKDAFRYLRGQDLQKKAGGFWLLFNWWALNMYIWKFWFHMLTLATIVPSLSVMDWFTIPCLKDAYFHTSFCQNHCKYLWFMVASCHFQYQVFPDVLFTAPRLFTKCLSVLAAHLRSQGTFVCPI